MGRWGSGLRAVLAVAAASVIAAGCSGGGGTRAARELDPIAERYARLVLAMAPHDKDYVDAYYGPAAWRAEAVANPRRLADIAREADSLVALLQRAPGRGWKSPDRLRRPYLEQQLRALSARCAVLGGTKMRFDDESRALYGAVAPEFADSTFERILTRMDSLLPGHGSLAERFHAFRDRFVVPPGRVDTMFATAIRACRERTLRHITLPPAERFTLEYVKGKPWAAYNWYRGNYESLIQINTDLPTHIEDALGIAGHEGYPGHHVQNVLLESGLVKRRGWLDFTIYPLFTPESFIAEGAADFGVDLTFPDRERLEFEKSVLFPLAGLDTTLAERYFKLRMLTRELRYAAVEAARRYLDGRTTREEAIAWQQKFELLTREEATQQIAFFDQYRSYVINYSVGKDVVRGYVETHAARDRQPDRAWRAFTTMLSGPAVVAELH